MQRTIEEGLMKALRTSGIYRAPNPDLLPGQRIKDLRRQALACRIASA